MVKKFVFAALCSSLAAPVLAEPQAHIGISYMGSVYSEIEDFDDTETESLDYAGGRAVVHIPIPKYFYWGLEADYGSDSAYGIKEELTNVKAMFGGRIPAGDHWAFRPYLGGAQQEFRATDTETDLGSVSLDGSGVLFGLGIDFQPIEALDMSVHAEHASLGDFSMIEAGLAVYWNFTQTLSVGGGVRHRNFDFDYGDDDELGLNFTYLELGMRFRF